MKSALALLLLMTAALSVRAHDLGQPVVTFHPTRHYRSALIARACYYDVAAGTPVWARRVADANRSMQPAGEPPFMEWLACGAYLALGHEQVEIPRALAAIAWVAGAVPLYLLAVSIASMPAAFVAAAIYLFLPYGIVASRNFQPDALMTLCSLWALVALLRHHNDPGPRRLCVASLAVGLAILVKPMSVFLMLPVLGGFGLLRIVSSGSGIPGYWQLATLLLLSLVPGGLYYGHSTLFGTLAKDQMGMRFVPGLLTTSFFWHGWLTQIRRVFTLPLLIVGVLGAAVAPGLPGRVLLAALWLGYVAFAVAFTYHMPTHDYYHWPFISAVALGAAAAISRLQGTSARRAPARSALVVAAVVCVVVAGVGSWRAWPRLTVPAADAMAVQYRDIGELTQHDTQILFLDTAYGYPLMYHGELSGDSWPNTDDLAAETLGHEAPMDAQTRFDRDYADFAPRYFVVTDIGSLNAQRDLQALLARRAVLMRKTPTYQVYKFVG